MKLIIVQDQLRNGGTERQSLFLAENFASNGHTVHLLVFRPGGHLCQQVQNGQLPFTVEFLQSFNSGLSLWAPGLMRTLRKKAPDCILCMGRTANCYAGFIQRAFPEVPVIGTLRTGKVLFPLHHWSMGQVRAVITNSNWWKRRMLDRGFPPGKIHVVHNAVLLERTEAERIQKRKQMRDRYGITDDCCVFLNVAGFRSGKRHMEMLRAVASIRQQAPDLNWKLWLVGDGREMSSCQRWVAANGLGTRVRFFHFQHDPFPFYAAGDAAISTSQEDSLPNFLVEAQATGLPVIAYDCRGVNETFQHGSTGRLVPANDRFALEQALLDFASRPEMRRSLGAGAPAFAASRFSPAPQADAMRHFLESLA